MTASRLNVGARPTLFLLAVLGCARLASAQDTHPYASGAIEMSTWGVHSFMGAPSISYQNTSDDTKVVGIVGEGGMFLSRYVAVGAEIDIPFRRNGVTNGHGYFDPYNRLSRYQEWSVFGIVHGYVPAGRRVRAGILAGGGIVFASSLDRISSCNFDPGIPCTPFGPEQEATRSAFGATIGSDLVIQATRRLSIVPQFRVVWVDRGEDPASANATDRPFVILGIDRVSYRAGIGLRVTF
jgi:hypothetical protein